MLQGGSLLVCSGDGGDGGDRAGSDGCGNGNLTELLAPYGVALQADAVISLVQQAGPLQSTASCPPHRLGVWILLSRRVLAAQNATSQTKFKTPAQIYCSRDSSLRMVAAVSVEVAAPRPRVNGPLQDACA